MNYQSAGMDGGKTRKYKVVLREEAPRLNFGEKDSVTADVRLGQGWRQKGCPQVLRWLACAIGMQRL